MAIDLAKLSAELTAAGVKVLGRYHENTGGYLQVPVAAGSYLYVITDGSEPIDWPAIDIIRRHLAPVAPVPAAVIAPPVDSVTIPRDLARSVYSALAMAKGDIAEANANAILAILETEEAKP